MEVISNGDPWTILNFLIFRHTEKLSVFDSFKKTVYFTIDRTLYPQRE